MPDKRVKDQLVDAAASSRNVVLGDVLTSYSRDRLKELCRALGLDDAGKEKALLVDRLAGTSGVSVSSTVPPRAMPEFEARRRRLGVVGGETQW